MSVIGYVPENVMSRFMEKFNNFDFGPQNALFTQFCEYHKNPRQFYQLVNARHQVHCQKNLMDRFREKFKTVNFVSKNASYIPFLAQEFSSKYRLRHFYILVEP